LYTIYILPQTALDETIWFMALRNPNWTYWRENLHLQEESKVFVDPEPINKFPRVKQIWRYNMELTLVIYHYGSVDVTSKEINNLFDVTKQLLK